MYNTHMNKALAAKVVCISKEVRSWVKELARKRGHGGDYDLNGYCAIASAELFLRFKAAGVLAEMHLSATDIGSHVFILLDDHIVDVTATQFSEMRYEPIVVQHEKELAHLWYYQTDYIFNCPRNLRNSQVSWGWPQDQLVLTRQARQSKKT